MTRNLIRRLRVKLPTVSTQSKQVVTMEMRNVKHSNIESIGYEVNRPLAVN